MPTLEVSLPLDQTAIDRVLAGSPLWHALQGVPVARPVQRALPAAYATALLKARLREADLLAQRDE